MEKELRIIISGGGTGGHIFPAVSIANAIIELRPDAKILFVGVSKIDDFRHVDMEGESNDTLRILWPPVVEASLLRIFRKSVST